MDIERQKQSIEDISRSFGVSGEVEVVCKPKGFNTWCRLPYPNHPLGCPNFNKREGCPPKTEYFLDVFEPEVKIAYLNFNFEEYLNWRRGTHPDWTDRALRNPRHFQRHLDAVLRKNIKSLKMSETLIPVYDSEAMGVNIHKTCSTAGIDLQWPPKDRMYRIALLAKKIMYT